MLEVFFLFGTEAQVCLQVTNFIYIHRDDKTVKVSGKKNLRRRTSSEC